MAALILLCCPTFAAWGLSVVPKPSYLPCSPPVVGSEQCICGNLWEDRLRSVAGALCIHPWLLRVRFSLSLPQTSRFLAASVENLQRNWDLGVSLRQYSGSITVYVLTDKNGPLR